MPEDIVDDSAPAAEKPVRKSRAKKSADPVDAVVAAGEEAVEAAPAAEVKPKRTRAKKSEPAVEAALAVAAEDAGPDGAAPALIVADAAIDAIVATAAADLEMNGEPEANEAFVEAEEVFEVAPAAKRESGAQRRARKKAESDAASHVAPEAAVVGAPDAVVEFVPSSTQGVDGETIEPGFALLGLGEALQKALKDVGYEEPTPIQVQTIPVLLAGKDVIAQAQTGSGKTAAFGLPIIEAIDPNLRALQALILCPTRELAIQVSEALHKYGKHKEVETLPIYGGQPYERQFRGLQRGVQIVVGTPGRVMDHMRRGTLNLDNLRFFVLDEADEMLDMGFIDDIEWILEHAPAGRQTALFSATMPPRIADLARQHLRDPQRITVAGKEMTVPQITQVSYEIPRARKVDALTRVLDAETPTSAMIFCRTKNQVDELGEALMARGYAVETLHGDLSQVQRDRVMRRFRGGQADILIATDVAARGLDIPDVSHVVNYDIPDSAEAYVHRIGRTGRAGRSGTAITLITPRETRWLRQIERTTRGRIEPRRLPTLTDVAERRREIMKQQILAVLEQGDSWSPYLSAVEDISDEHDVAEVAAAILKLYAEETGRTVMQEAQEDDLVAISVPTPPAPMAPRNDAGMVKLTVSVGRQHGIRPQDIVGAIANEANIPGRAIGAIDIYDAFSYVDVPQEFVSRVLGSMGGIRMKGVNVRVEIAQGVPAGSQRPPQGGFRGGPPRDGGGGGFRGGPPPQRGGFDRAPQGGGGYRGGPQQGGFDRDRDRAPQGGGGYRGGPPQGGNDRDRAPQGGQQQGGFRGDPMQGGYDRDRAPQGGGGYRSGQQGGYDRDRAPQGGQGSQGGYRGGPQQGGSDRAPAPRGPYAPRRDAAPGQRPPQVGGVRTTRQGDWQDNAPTRNTRDRDDYGAPAKRFERTGPGTFKRRTRED